MPQAVTNPSNAYVMLHELNKSQLNVGEVQISGLCAKCSALGKLLTQQVTQHQLNIKKSKANKLCAQINEISGAINKNLVQQLPLIKMQMEKSLSQMALPEGAHTTHAQTAQDQTYIKTVNLLQDNIVRIDQELEVAAQRIFEAIPPTKQNELQKLFKALTIYQSTLCGANLMSTEFSRLSIFLGCLKSNTELYIGGISDQSEKAKLEKFSSTIDQLITKNKILFEAFQAQEINNLPVLKVFDSAKQKHLNLTQQLNEGDLGNADILLAIAQRHETDSIVAYGLQEMEVIHSEYNHLAEEVMGSLQKFQLDDINSLAEELIQSEPVVTAAAPVAMKKPPKTANIESKQETKRDTASNPETVKNPGIVKTPFAKKFHVELSKLADWLKHDVKTLSNSKSDEKRKLGQVIAEQLDVVYDQIETSQWPAIETEAQTRKADIEQRLNSLEKLIADAMTISSSASSPASSIENSSANSTITSQPISPETVDTKSTESLQSTQPQPPVAVAVKSAPVVEKTALPEKAKSVLTPDSATPVVNINPGPRQTLFDSQLQSAIQKLNSVRTKMFDAYSRQENFRQRLLESNQPYSIAWLNVSQSDMVLDYISQNISYHPHTVYVKPYMEHRLPMAEMIHSIQAERFHPHFDQRNCQAYLGRASNWLDTFTPHFEYLDQLMSVTESMLTNDQRVA